MTILKHGILSQRAIFLEVDLSSLFFDYQQVYCPNSPATTVTINVTTTGINAWTATPSDSWINITGGSGTGSGSFDVSVDANGGIERIGTITISSDAPDVIVDVDQSATGDACP